MVRQARAMVHSGVIGAIRQVHISSMSRVTSRSTKCRLAGVSIQFGSARR